MIEKSIILIPTLHEKDNLEKLIPAIFNLMADVSILVVDDEDALRTVLSAELNSEGYDVGTAADGVEALAELQKKNYDLALLDIKMPNMNGFEVLKVIKEKYAGTKVIMLTGFADLKNAIESKKLGAEDFVSKPYDLVDLLTTIDRVMSD